MWVSIEQPSLRAGIIHEHPCVFYFLLNTAEGGNGRRMQPAANRFIPSQTGLAVRGVGGGHGWRLDLILQEFESINLETKQLANN